MGLLPRKRNILPLAASNTVHAGCRFMSAFQNRRLFNMQFQVLCNLLRLKFFLGFGKIIYIQLIGLRRFSKRNAAAVRQLSCRFYVQGTTDCRRAYAAPAKPCPFFISPVDDIYCFFRSFSAVSIIPKNFHTGSHA